MFYGYLKDKLFVCVYIYILYIYVLQLRNYAYVKSSRKRDHEFSKEVQGRVGSDGTWEGLEGAKGRGKSRNYILIKN